MLVGELFFLRHLAREKLWEDPATKGRMSKTPGRGSWWLGPWGGKGILGWV